MKEKKRKPEKKNERGEAIRAYFVRLFGKYDVRDEEQFRKFVKWTGFILLLIVEALTLLQCLDNYLSGGGLEKFLLFLIIVATLTISMALQLFVVKGKGRIVFYVIDAVAACAFLFFVGGRYALIIYMLVLTQFYFEAKRPRQSIVFLSVSIILYTCAYALQLGILHGVIVGNILQLLGMTFGYIVGFITHFLAAQIALAFYRQYLKLDKTLKALEESKRELEKAYAVVAEVAALEERQRIAKDIHDTAGHSLTTVIMQTETAKRLLESNPAEAKTKLVAANLQAKHALEELRDSVHLLSGASENATLKDALESILHESTDGTGITIRSEVDEANVLPAKHRFLCNTLKEGIANGLRHGGATAFWFELKTEGEKLRFLLSDNGKGVGEQGLQEGFGLRTMRERARALGGEVTFVSDIEEGFEIHLTLPVDIEGV